MGSFFKKLAGIALPIVGNIVAPGIGGIIGAGLGGAIGGGGIKGALQGIAGQALGNVAGGVLGNIGKAGGLFNGVSLLGNASGGGGVLGRLLGGTGLATQGGPMQTALPGGNSVSWNTPRINPGSIAGSVLPSTATASAGGSQGVLGQLLGGLGDNGMQLLDVAQLLLAGEPEGLRTQQSIENERLAAIEKQKRSDQLFLNALNAAPLDRAKLNPDIDYSTYGQGPGQGEAMFFGEPNPPLPVASFNKGGLVRGQGSGQEDTVPAMLAPYEYVMTAEEVSAAGDGNPEEGAKKLGALGRTLVKEKRKSKGRNPKKAPKKLKEKM